MDPRGGHSDSDSALMSSLEGSKYDDVSGEVDALTSSLRVRKRPAPATSASSSSSAGVAAPSSAALHGSGSPNEAAASTLAGSGTAGTPGSGTPHQVTVSTPTGTDMDPDEYDDDDDDDEYSAKARGGMGVGSAGAGAAGAGTGNGAGNGKRVGGGKRHNWQTKYEMEFGLLPIERDPVTNDVTLAMCGFCKAFGRESKYEQMVQADADLGESKKRRRRSLTTTKFFRAFRVDNIRSHLLGAHPRRWAEYDMLPKQETIRTRFLQMHASSGAGAMGVSVGVGGAGGSGSAVVNSNVVSSAAAAAEYHQYDGLSMVDDVALHAAGLHDQSDLGYSQSQSSGLVSNQVLGENQQLQANALSSSASAALVTAASTQLVSPLAYPGMTKGSNVKEYQQDPTQQLRKRNNRQVAGVAVEAVTSAPTSSSSVASASSASCTATTPTAGRPSNSSSLSGHPTGASANMVTGPGNAGSGTGFDYEKHLLDQLALDRERLAFEKSKFKKEVELRERELAQREKHMEQRRLLFEQEKELLEERAQLENDRLMRLVDLIRQGILPKTPTSTTGSSAVEEAALASSSTTI